MVKVKQPEKTLPGLPAELIDNVAENLDKNDVAALHLVNSALFHKTKYAYGKHFLSDVSVFLHPASFEKLSIIANDPCYSTTVEHVAFSTYVLRDKYGRRKDSSKLLLRFIAPPDPAYRVQAKSIGFRRTLSFVVPRPRQSPTCFPRHLTSNQ